MTRLALITGITGQDGSYLSELLLEKNYKVFGIVRRNSSVFNYERINHIKDRINLKYGDLTDGSSMVNFINEIISTNKDYEVLEIYNLGAQSHVQISFQNPEYTSLVDGIGTLKLLEAIRALAKENQSKIRFYQASTSEMYGQVLETPQKETTPFNPQSPYACAKVYSHFIVKNYREGYNLFACSGILFNHESTLRSKYFLTRKITYNLARLKVESGEPLTLGNLNMERDWSSANDVVRGMHLSMLKNQASDYVFASGKRTSVRTFLILAATAAGFEPVFTGNGLEEKCLCNKTNQVLAKVSMKHFREVDTPGIAGDFRKAHELLEWKPTRSVAQIAEEMMAEDLQRWRRGEIAH